MLAGVDLEISLFQVLLKKCFVMCHDGTMVDRPYMKRQTLYAETDRILASGDGCVRRVEAAFVPGSVLKANINSSKNCWSESRRYDLAMVEATICLLLPLSVAI